MSSGQTVGHYNLLEPLGTGGMGTVYRAYDTVLQRAVAIKIPHDAGGLDEARHASLVSHPNICTIHEVIEQNGKALIVMELVDGEPLSEILRAQTLAVPMLRRWIAEIADAVAHAHYRGVVHGDLKSANVIVTRDQRVKVLDFGLATRVAVKASEADTQPAASTGPAVQGGVTGGTLAYMAPELLRGGSADERTDVWALGVLFHEMATGVLPFTGRTAFELGHAILALQQIVLPPRVPSDIGGVIERCLARHPDERYQTSGEIRAALQSHTAPRRQSIAVLPFEDASAEHDQEYFCEGMAEELINALTAIDGVEVASRTSSFQFKGQTTDLAEIGKRLNVATVLEGTVRTSGNRLRVTVQLVNVANNFQIWSDRYDRDIGDVFVMQDEIARAILDKLKVKLGADAGAVVKPQTQDLEAYHLYLQGRYYWVRRYRGFIGKAVESFQHAITHDPSYALAYAGLADCFTTLAIQGALTPLAAGAKAKNAAERAVVLGENLAEAHTSMAFVRYFVDWDFDEAERECRVAIARNPAAGAPRGMLAAFLASRRQFDAAMTEAREAARCEPMSTLVGYYAVFARLFSGEFEQAWEEGQALVDLDPHLAQSYFVVAIAASQTGRHQEALEASKRALELSNGWSRAMSNLGATYGAAGMKDEARQVLEELRRQSQERHVSPLDLSFIAAQIGEHTAACELLERAHEERQPLMMFVAVYPWLFPLRPLARFQQLLRRMGL